MNIYINDISEIEAKTEALILPFFEDDKKDFYSHIDSLIGGLIKRVIRSKEFNGKHNEICNIHAININAERLLLLGLGKVKELTAEKIRQAGGKTFSYLKAINVKEVSVSSRIFDNLNINFPYIQRPIFYLLEGGLLGTYKFERYKKSENGNTIKTINILSENKELPLNWLKSSIESVYLARDLVNTPANDMTPNLMSKVAESISHKRIKLKILEKKDIEKEGMGALLAVSKGSKEPVNFIVLEYKGGVGSPIVLIGKSITFDSGGISLKPSDGMEKMKYDMAGGAVVLSIIKAVSQLKFNMNIIGILPATENLPGGNATRPGDVVKSLSGKTIEIINTDAEGRLILADAIEYALKYYKPRAIIDIATLTGACSIALGNEAIAMMGNDPFLMKTFKKASEETYERVWQMPLYDEYKDYLKSDIADIKNSGGKNGSLVTAGYFLKEFVGDTPWVHLDIASTAWTDKDRPYQPKGATGVGVRLLLNFLKELQS